MVVSEAARKRGVPATEIRSFRCRSPRKRETRPPIHLEGHIRGPLTRKLLVLLTVLKPCIQRKRGRAQNCWCTVHVSFSVVYFSGILNRLLVVIERKCVRRGSCISMSDRLIPNYLGSLILQEICVHSTFQTLSLVNSPNNWLIPSKSNADSEQTVLILSTHTVTNGRLAAVNEEGMLHPDASLS
jgi:hypothetical protein